MPLTSSLVNKLKVQLKLSVSRRGDDEVGGRVDADAELEAPPEELHVEAIDPLAELVVDVARGIARIVIAVVEAIIDDGGVRHVERDGLAVEGADLDRRRRGCHEGTSKEQAQRGSEGTARHAGLVPCPFDVLATLLWAPEREMVRT